MPDQQQENTENIRTYKILVVEDNPNDRVLYRRLLERSKNLFMIAEVDTVQDALTQAESSEFDCVLLDYRLPDGSGIEFIKTCRQKKLHQYGAIVMVTGQGDEQTAVEAMKLGALDYIAKDTIADGFFVQNIMNAIERASLKKQVKEYQSELEKSYHTLSDFTHTVSHDLKAPLRRIIQYCDLLGAEAGDTLNENCQNYISRLNISATRMQHLIDDLLIYSRTMYAQESKEETSLLDIVKSVLEDLKPQIDDTQATVNIDDLPSLPVYPVRIKELFQNLIENALKYRNAKAPVIHISCTENDDHYLLSVQDNGNGIGAQYHETIFKEFERLQSQEEIEGTGLGLSICKKVVEMHRGKIWVESESGNGATFKFVLAKT